MQFAVVFASLPRRDVRGSGKSIVSEMTPRDWLRQWNIDGHLYPINHGVKCISLAGHRATRDMAALLANNDHLHLEPRRNIANKRLREWQTLTNSWRNRLSCHFNECTTVESILFLYIFISYLHQRQLLLYLLENNANIYAECIHGAYAHSHFAANSNTAGSSAPWRDAQHRQPCSLTGSPN